MTGSLAPNLQCSTTTGTLSNGPSTTSTVPTQCLTKTETLNSSPARRIYHSQEQLLESKARKLQLRVREVFDFLRERLTIAQTRFGSQSQEWQKWFAESSVWNRYCKLIDCP